MIPQFFLDLGSLYNSWYRGNYFHQKHSPSVSTVNLMRTFFKNSFFFCIQVMSAVSSCATCGKREYMCLCVQAYSHSLIPMLDVDVKKKNTTFADMMFSSFF